MPYIVLERLLVGFSPVDDRALDGLGPLHMCIATIMVGSALWSLFGAGTPRLGIALLKVVASSALTAVALTGLIAYVQRTRVGRADGRFVFSWPASAGMLLFLAVTELNVLTDQNADWHRIHRTVGLVSLLLIAASFTCLLTAVSRYRRHGARLLDDSPDSLTAARRTGRKWLAMMITVLFEYFGILDQADMRRQVFIARLVNTASAHDQAIPVL